MSCVEPSRPSLGLLREVDRLFAICIIAQTDADTRATAFFDFKAIRRWGFLVPKKLPSNDQSAAKQQNSPYTRQSYIWIHEDTHRFVQRRFNIPFVFGASIHLEFRLFGGARMGKSFPTNSISFRQCGQRKQGLGLDSSNP